MAYYSIGQVAKQTNTSVEAIRFYEKEGLLQKAARLANGYRQYTSATLTELHFIQKAKAAGFNLKEIKELLNLTNSPDTSCSVVTEKVVQKLAEIHTKIEALSAIEHTLSQLAQECSGAGKIEDCAIINNFEH